MYIIINGLIEKNSLTTVYILLLVSIAEVTRTLGVARKKGHTVCGEGERQPSHSLPEILFHPLSVSSEERFRDDESDVGD
tara:strand:- start:222 stop:461 length:240 start_codon:yes stop_codon:yes gene_type:complete